jgi:hypothetical protein
MPIDYGALGRLSTTAHDPRPPADEVDPMTDRRNGSAGFYAGVDRALAAQPARPSYTTRTEGTDEAGYVITYDDGLGTVIKVEPTDRIGVTVLEVTSLGDTVRVELGAFATDVLDKALRAVAGSNIVSPIKGSR